MPLLGGRALAEVVAADDPGVRVLYISGYTDDAVLRNGVLQSESAFLQKPFTVAALLHKVREVLDKGAGAPPAWPLTPASANPTRTASPSGFVGSAVNW
jgi:hypothetical protein